MRVYPCCNGGSGWSLLILITTLVPPRRRNISFLCGERDVEQKSLLSSRQISSFENWLYSLYYIYYLGFKFYSVFAFIEKIGVLKFERALNGQVQIRYKKSFKTLNF